MRCLGVIPARYGSTRLPAKPLISILGKPLLQWVIEGARTSQKITSLVVATDHPAIADVARSCGVDVAMTNPELPSGSDRVWAALKEFDCDVAVNIQGDEPLISGALLDALVTPFEKDATVEMATLARNLKNGDLQSPNTAKVVVNQRGDAIYFSRLAIPFSRGQWQDFPGAAYKHIGLYAYRPQFLQRFCESGPVDIEKAEGLEQLRALYLGARIAVVVVEAESWGVDTPDDVGKVTELLKQRGGHGG